MDGLKKDLFWNTLGSLVSGFVVFILTVFITRLNGVHESGAFGFAFSIAAIFSTVAFYGGRNYQVTDVGGEFKTGDYVKLRLIMSLLALIATVIFVMLNNFDTKITLLIIVLMGYRVLDAISDVLYGILQVHDRLFIAGKSNLIKSAVSTLAFMLVDYLSNDIVLASSVFIVIFIAGIIFFDIPNINRIRPIEKTVLGDWSVGEIAIKLLPFALIMILPTVLNNISKYFIQLWHPSDQGYFNILILPLFFLNLVILFIVAPLLTRLARMLKSGKITDFKKIVNKISFVTISIGVLLLPVTYVVGPSALELVFGVSFEQYRAQLVIIVMSGILYTLAFVYSSILVILRKINIQLIILAILLLVNIILSIAIIRPLSINGAIIVSIITNAVWLMIFWLVYNIDINKYEENK